MNVKQERYEYTHALEMDGQVFHVREMLRCQEKEQLA